MATELSGARAMTGQLKKCETARAPVDLVHHGMTVVPGIGPAVAFWLPPLPRRSSDSRFVALPPGPEDAAREVGLGVEDFISIERFAGIAESTELIDALHDPIPLQFIS